MPQSLFPRRYYIDSEGADVSSLASRQNRPGTSSNAVRQDLVAHFCLGAKTSSAAALRCSGFFGAAQLISATLTDFAKTFAGRDTASRHRKARGCWT
jgi:hypothetical protein